MQRLEVSGAVRPLYVSLGVKGLNRNTAIYTLKKKTEHGQYISSNSILSVCLLIMLDTLLLRPSLHCNTSLHFTTLHPTTFHYTYRHFTSSHIHFTTLTFDVTHMHFYRSITPHITKLDTVQFHASYFRHII